MKKNDLLILKVVNSTRTFLWSILFIIGSSVITRVAYSTDEAAVQNQYLQQCERKLAPAQCQRKATLRYQTEQHTLKQQKIIQTQAIRILKMQQKTVHPRLSQQQKPPKKINEERPLLQGNLAKSNAIILKNPRLISAKKHKYTQANSLLVKPRLTTAKNHKYALANALLIKPIKVKPAINFTKRQADSNQNRIRRLAKNNKRREQGFIVDAVVVP
ncbi:MAG: hypothetical protein RI956_698 [Pseudomonadota bacterium]|jgi:hypothetical protein